LWLIDFQAVHPRQQLESFCSGLIATGRKHWVRPAARPARAFWLRQRKAMGQASLEELELQHTLDRKR
jgi:hypothetical protein